jgi:hypothetical protein
MLFLGAGFQSRRASHVDETVNELIGVDASASGRGPKRQQAGFKVTL